MSDQPTIQELSDAWTRAIECEGIGGSDSESRAELKRLRDLKTTWFGLKENQLRVAIDGYIRWRATGELPRIWGGATPTKRESLKQARGAR